MKKFTLLFLLLIVISTTSCSSSAMHFYLKRYGIYDENTSVQVYTNLNKTIAYIPMKHIGPKQFYQNVTNKVDSLQTEGYIVFLEGTLIDSINLTKEQQDTVMLKMRWMTGIALNKRGYLDTVNGTLMGIPFKNKKGIINQPRYKKLGIDTIKDRLVDVKMNLLVDEYESKYGKIILEECDYSTSIDQDIYKCHTIDQDKYDYIVMHYRNKKLAESIMNENHNKIAILYGAKHEIGMFEELKALDSNWRKVLSAAEIRDQNLYH